jgi:hypothetical protein
MRAKPNKRWVAQLKASGSFDATPTVDAPTWFLARAAAAVLLRADPDEIDVREAP